MGMQERDYMFKSNTCTDQRNLLTLIISTTVLLLLMSPRKPVISKKILQYTRTKKTEYIESRSKYMPRDLMVQGRK
jgi:hypothetical protein